jgi:hypothetical protein
MADRPIIFSAPMVKALIEGRKTPTRRILKPQPVPCLSWSAPPPGTYPSDKGWSRLPYELGDRLWVREGACWVSAWGWRYRADNDDLEDKRASGEVGPWRSPIHMPRHASRLTLTVTEVRVQRLQDITLADARAEGVWFPELFSFLRLWNSLHGPDAWDANPWVCAISFTVEQRNIDA